MRKTILIGALILCTVIVGAFVFNIINENGENQISVDSESNLTFKDKEELTKVISYIEDKFSNREVLNNVYYHDKRKAIVTDTNIHSSDMKAAEEFDVELNDLLGLYNGNRVSYKVVVNFSNGTPFSVITVLN